MIKCRKETRLPSKESKVAVLALKPSTTKILPKTPESSDNCSGVKKQSTPSLPYKKKLDFLMGTQDASKMRDEKKLAKKLNQIEQLKLKNATLSEENRNLSAHLLHSKLKTTPCCWIMKTYRIAIKN